MRTGLAWVLTMLRDMSGSVPVVRRIAVAACNTYQILHVSLHIIPLHTSGTHASSCTVMLPTLGTNTTTVTLDMD